MRIGLLLRKWRLINDIAVKELAAEIGISVATLYRMENFGAHTDGVTLLKILNWLCADVKGEKKDG